MSSQTGRDDVLLQSVRALILRRQNASTIMLQAEFKIGYARAGRMLDALEDEGVVGEYNGSKARRVLMPAPGA